MKKEGPFNLNSSEKVICNMEEEDFIDMMEQISILSNYFIIVGNNFHNIYKECNLYVRCRI